MYLHSREQCRPLTPRSMRGAICGIAKCNLETQKKFQSLSCKLQSTPQLRFIYFLNIKRPLKAKYLHCRQKYHHQTPKIWFPSPKAHKLCPIVDNEMDVHSNTTTEERHLSDTCCNSRSTTGMNRTMQSTSRRSTCKADGWEPYIPPPPLSNDWKKIAYDQGGGGGRWTNNHQTRGMYIVIYA